MKHALSLAVGVALSAAVLTVAAALDHVDDALTVDGLLAGIGLVVAGAVALGVNLGNWIAIRSLDDYGHTVPAPGTALHFALVSAGLVLGGVVSASIVV